MRLRSFGLFVSLALAAGPALAQTPPAAGVAAPAPVESAPLPAPAATPAAPEAPAQTAPAQATPAPAAAAPATPAADPVKEQARTETPKTEAAKPEAPAAQPPAAPAQTPAPAPGTAPAETAAQPQVPAPAPTPAPAAPAVAGRTTLFPNPGDPTNVEEGVLVAKPAAVLQGTSSWDEAFKTLKESFRRIEDELKKAGIAPTGRPVTVFLHTDDAGFRFEAMIPIAQAPEGRTELTTEIKFGRTPEGKAFRFVHKDAAYDEIDGTYETITAYLDAKDIVSKDVFVEEYVNDLTDGQDTNLEVNIYVQPKE